MFVDLVASMRLTEGWDAEDARELLSGYYEVAKTVVARHGGIVEKFIGDAVVAVWGSKSSRDDDAAQCVRSGLEIMDAVAGFGAARGLVGMIARAGVVTGHLAARASVDEGLVAGDRVNLAARIHPVAALLACHALEGVDAELARRAADRAVVVELARAEGAIVDERLVTTSAGTVVPIRFAGPLRATGTLRLRRLLDLAGEGAADITEPLVTGDLAVAAFATLERPAGCTRHLAVTAGAPRIRRPS